MNEAEQPAAQTLDQQMDAMRGRLLSLQPESREYVTTLGEYERLHRSRWPEPGEAPAAPVAVDPIVSALDTADDQEASDFERDYPLEGLHPETQQPFRWDHPTRRALQQQADELGVRDLADQALALAAFDVARPVPDAREWESALRAMWGGAFATRYELMHLALDRLESTPAGAWADDLARRSPRFAAVLAEIGATITQRQEIQ